MTAKQSSCFQTTILPSILSTLTGLVESTTGGVNLTSLSRRRELRVFFSAGRVVIGVVMHACAVERLILHFHMFINTQRLKSTDNTKYFLTKYCQDIYPYFPWARNLCLKRGLCKLLMSLLHPICVERYLETRLSSQVQVHQRGRESSPHMMDKI